MSLFIKSFQLFLGTNTGAHLYVDFPVDPITISVVTGMNSYSRSFSIKVTQIECISLNRAREGCMQNFHGVSGIVFRDFHK